MVTDLTPTRRAVLAGFGALALFPRPAAALTTGTAESLVRQMVDDIKRVINSGGSESAILSEFERLFERYADVPTIARFALGAPARGASQGDLRAYTDAFSTYIARKYGQRFEEFIGGDVTINRSRVDRNGIVVVETTADLRGEDPFAVDFHISDRSGSPRLFNVIIEGVNMLTTERTEIGALYDQAGRDVGALAQRLRNV
jgi:phospholipid transport system substrate-binding protein